MILVLKELLFLVVGIVKIVLIVAGSLVPAVLVVIILLFVFSAHIVRILISLGTTILLSILHLDRAAEVLTAVIHLIVIIF